MEKMFTLIKKTSQVKKITGVIAILSPSQFIEKADIITDHLNLCACICVVNILHATFLLVD
jgi:hypothetical protein